MAFLEIDGYGVEYTLAPGQQMVIDTGNLAMMDATCSIDIQSVTGEAGGEGDHPRPSLGGVKVLEHGLPGEHPAEGLADPSGGGLHVHVRG